jgi:hypothetical protein
MQAKFLHLIDHIRKNHGLEHATLQLLSGKFPRRSMGGYSDPRGFWLVGDLPTEEVMRAVAEALGRLRSGESSLALHPNCGTNFLAAGLLAGLGAFAAMLNAGPRKRDQLERLPVVVSLATLGVMLAQPLGYLLQERYTTTGDMSGLKVLSVQRVQRSGVGLHRVYTSLG